MSGLRDIIHIITHVISGNQSYELISVTLSPLRGLRKVSRDPYSRIPVSSNTCASERPHSECLTAP